MEEVMHQITLDEWLSWKEDIRVKLRETAENFVHIGYRLRQIRDSGMFDGAADIFEFAQREYGLGKSTTSRFIAINEKFSNNSLELRPEFKAIGSSKLSEMLTLPDEECELITEHTTVKEIRELKSMVKEEKQAEKEAEKTAEAAEVLEVAEDYEQEIHEETEPSEGPEVQTEELTAEEAEIKAASEEFELTPTQKCIEDYFRDKPDTLNELIPAIAQENWNRCVDLMNPSGYGTHRKGTVMMFMYGLSEGVKCKVAGEGIKQYTWQEMLELVYDTYRWIQQKKAKEEKPDEPAERQELEASVATSQQEGKEAPVEEAAEPDETNKNLVLHDVDTNIPLPDPKPEEFEKPDIVEIEKPEELDEQIPGQDEIENHGEWMPDKVSNRTELEESGAESEESEQKTEENEHFSMNAPTESATVRGYKGAITNNLRTLSQIWESGRPDKEKAKLMKDIADDLSWRLERMIDMIEIEDEEDEE